MRAMVLNALGSVGGQSERRCSWPIFPIRSRPRASC